MKNKPSAEAAVTPENAPQAQVLTSLIDLSRPTVQPARTAERSLHNNEK